MKLKSMKISGFRPIPFAAVYTPPEGRNTPAQITWSSDAFCINFATDAPALHAIIGPNSSGKSSVLYAIEHFFGRKTKFSDQFYNNKDTTQPIIIEITLQGPISEPADWHSQNCQLAHDDIYELTVASVWEFDETRSFFVRRPDGSYVKISRTVSELKELVPEIRLIPANSNLPDDAKPEKNSLILDLIQHILQGPAQQRNRSIIYKLHKGLRSLLDILDRNTPPNRTAWREVEELEKALSSGIGPLTAGTPAARLRIDHNIPTIDQIFQKARFRIDDGVELEFEEHGLGVQRSFIASALRAWCQMVPANRPGQHYIFAIEEPELYLHPHAERVFMEILEEIAQAHQVILTTHSPEFVNWVPLDNVICIRREQNLRRIVQPNLTGLDIREKTKVQRYLLEDKSDMLFARAVLLVEGIAEQFAIPGFAAKLGVEYSLNRAGVSVVLVNGKGNFETYHQILQAFGIPHVVLADGDGNRSGCQNRLEGYGIDSSNIFVFENDFEWSVVSTINETRFLELVNECRNRRGANQLSLNDLSLDTTPNNLKSHWWNALKKKLNADIHANYRDNYDNEKSQIEAILDAIAQRVITCNHLLASGREMRKVAILQREGKPLVGRVLGELLTAEEIQQNETIVQAMRRTIDIAQGEP